MVIRSAVLALGLAACLGSCETIPVTLRHQGAAEHIAELQQSAIGGLTLSVESQQLLRLMHLDDDYASSATSVPATLEEGEGDVPRWQRLLAAAEISFLLGHRAERTLSHGAARGHYLDATLLAFRSMLDLSTAEPSRFDPRLSTLSSVYDFALARLLLVGQSTAGHPAKWPAITTGRGEFKIRVQSGSKGFDPLYFDNLIPANTLAFEGLANRHRRYGFGSALVGVRRGDVEGRPRHEFHPAKGEFHPISAVLVPDARIEGTDGPRTLTLTLFDSYVTEWAMIHGHRVTLAADFTAPLAVLLSRVSFNKVTQTGMFDPEEPAKYEGLYLLEPYSPEKTTVVLVHGLLSQPTSWARVINELRRHRSFRERYQLWVYT